MSDCILFASLFTIYAVLSHGMMDCLVMHNKEEIFSIPFVFIETCCLLFSSISYGQVMIYVKKVNIKQINVWMLITFILGLFFISMECYEFYHLIKAGNTPSSNAFFSAFFVLVGTHGIHVVIGMIWIVLMVIHIMYKGLTYINRIRLQCLSLFWHFLDIIWICVFTEVYLLGVF
ncbi:cytochrome o ubiquinol oxidase subunit III [Candidatus Blochmannia ocreatus]|uniref:Cytochrome bo(3) ubiquinol oxidase subunit 3 n=2 Tax=Candidatus Blochmannia ocreatus (nom. nud.) TaxID=251538 RepID=A0ABY4STK4_9ENTR|nr:cytochrome o ubiquinol oxidase subunit III [Candidatus Blochmannia ocreatus]